MITSRAVKALAVFGAVQAAFDGMHGFADHWTQGCDDATNKGRPGGRGRAAAARHAATYTVTQVAAAAAVTRVLGARIRPAGLAAGAVATGLTHYAIDRRTGFKRLLRAVGKGPYLDGATVVRGDGAVADTGPGTALMELDESAHRAIGVATSALVAWLATR